MLAKTEVAGVQTSSITLPSKMMARTHLLYVIHLQAGTCGEMRVGEAGKGGDI